MLADNLNHVQCISIHRMMLNIIQKKTRQFTYVNKTRAWACAVQMSVGEDGTGKKSFLFARQVVRIIRKPSLTIQFQWEQRCKESERTPKSTLISKASLSDIHHLCTAATHIENQTSFFHRIESTYHTFLVRYFLR